MHTNTHNHAVKPIFISLEGLFFFAKKLPNHNLLIYQEFTGHMIHSKSKHFPSVGCFFFPNHYNSEKNHVFLCRSTYCTELLFFPICLTAQCSLHSGLFAINQVVRLWINKCKAICLITAGFIFRALADCQGCSGVQ